MSCFWFKPFLSFVFSYKQLQYSSSSIRFSSIFFCFCFLFFFDSRYSYKCRWKQMPYNCLKIYNTASITLNDSSSYAQLEKLVYFFKLTTHGSGCKPSLSNELESPAVDVVGRRKLAVCDQPQSWFSNTYAQTYCSAEVREGDAEVLSGSGKM